MAVLLVLALFVFGPERLPGMAADAGRTLRRARGYLKGMTTTSPPSSVPSSATSTCAR
jgi:Sec-independent protein translocase protein TatA